MVKVWGLCGRYQVQVLMAQDKIYIESCNHAYHKKKNTKMNISIVLISTTVKKKIMKTTFFQTRPCIREIAT